MSKASYRATRYKTTNWPQYAAAFKARGSLTLWLERDMQWLATPSGERGRQQPFSDANIQFCLSIKCLFHLPLRQGLGLVQSLLQRGQEVRNEAVRACQRFGRRLWKQWSGYHRCSLVKTKTHCFKHLGEQVIARTFNAQVVELQMRVALLNRFTQLGTPVTVAVA